MKGFIEVTNERGTKHLVNIRHIEEVINSTIYLDVVNPDCDEQDHIFCEESYEEIKAKIAKAVEDIVLPELKNAVIGDDVVMSALDIIQQKTDEELIERYYENANKEWIIT